MAENENGNQKNGKQLTLQRDVFGLADLREQMDRLWEAVTRRPRAFPDLKFEPAPAVDVFEIGRSPARAC